MKKIAFYTLICALLSFSSCALFELDNADAPAETLKGKVVDVITEENVRTDQGSDGVSADEHEGIRVRMTELSWGPNATPNNFFCKPDGTFQNTKVFKGTYKVTVDGPFIPLIRTNADNVVLADESQTVDIKGVTELTFNVQPFLNVEFDLSGITVRNGKIIAPVIVTRATSVDDFRAKVEPMGSYDPAFTNMTDIQLFVSYSSNVGYRSRDTRWSTEKKYSGAEFEPLFNTPVTIESNGDNPIPSGRTVYIRAAARINYATAGVKRWNYSEPMEIMIP